MDKSESVYNRYNRQMALPFWGKVGQEKLFSSTVAVIGCGALGCNIADLLVRAGVGKIRIIDRDVVEYRNLHRQVLFNEEDARKQIPKAVAAEKHLKKINSDVTVEGIVANATAGNIEKLCTGVNVLLDGLDNLESRYILNDAALKLRIPYIYGGAIATQGMTMNIIPGVTPCLRCVFPPFLPMYDLADNTSIGVIGMIPAIIGAIEATEAIKIIIGSAEINPNLTVIDLWPITIDNVRVEKDPECPACAGRYEFLNDR
jgi:adenylyltransferase/sulfurtransferase